MVFKTKTLSNNQRAVGYALVTVMFWSTVATAFKIGLRNLEPVQLIFIASVTTVVLLFSILLITNKLILLKQLTLKSILLNVLLGFLNPFMYYLVLFKAYSLLPAQVAQPLNMIWPIVLVLLSVPLLKHKIGWKSVVALLFSFAGVILISSQGKFFNFSDSNPQGVFLCFFSSIIWSLFWIFNLKNKEDELIKLFLNFVFGTLFLLVYLTLFSSFKIKLDQSFAAGIYIGLFEIGFSFILWMKALSTANNHAQIANLIYISPFLSLIFIHFILGERIYITTLIGLFFIISGILFQQTDKQKNNDKTLS